MNRDMLIANGDAIAAAFACLTGADDAAADLADALNAVCAVEVVKNADTGFNEAVPAAPCDAVAFEAGRQRTVLKAEVPPGSLSAKLAPVFDSYGRTEDEARKTLGHLSSPDPLRFSKYIADKLNLDGNIAVAVEMGKMFGEASPLVVFTGSMPVSIVSAREVGKQLSVARNAAFDEAFPKEKTEKPKRGKAV